VVARVLFLVFIMFDECSLSELEVSLRENARSLSPGD
ncbi:hypothetical protein A2U01_0108619, partial [Trifolium medium]|nr:hypothetical protein [Trifolium medium]